MAAGGPSFNQLMMLGGVGVAGIVLYELWINQANIQATIQNVLNPTNVYTQQGYYCPQGGTPSSTGICPNGQMAITSAQQQQMMGQCSDGSIVNPTTGRCANGSLPTPSGTSPYGTGYGAGGTGYPQTSVCNDGSQPNQVNGLCANGSYPSTVGTGVNNAMSSPYGAPQYVQPSIMGGVGVPGTTTFTDPTTGQMYDPSTGQLMTPGGAYNVPSLATPYGSIFPQLSPLQGPGFNSQYQTGCSDGSTPGANGLCYNGQPAVTASPVATTITTANPTGGMSCADGSTAANGLCANGQPPVTTLPTTTTPTPSGTVPVTATPTATGSTLAPVIPVAPTPTPTPVTPTPVTTPTVTQGPTTTHQRNRFSNQQQNQSTYPARSYVGYQNEGAMIAAQAFGYKQQDRSRATVTTQSSVRSKMGNSPITTELFNRRFYTSNPIYVSGIA